MDTTWQCSVFLLKGLFGVLTSGLLREALGTAKTKKQKQKTQKQQGNSFYFTKVSSQTPHTILPVATSLPLKVGSHQLDRQEERGNGRHGPLCLRWQVWPKEGPLGVRGEEEPYGDSPVSGLSKCHQEFSPNPLPQVEFTFPRDRRC